MKTSLELPCGRLLRFSAIFLFLSATSCYAQELIPNQSDATTQNSSLDYDATKTTPAQVDSTEQESGAKQQVSASPAPILQINTQPSPVVEENAPLITPENSAITAAIADGLTTNLALSIGAVESNSLILTSPLGLVAITGMKIGLVKYATTLDEPEKRLVLKSSSAVWGGAAVNNLMILFAAPPPFPIIAGLIMGIATWMNMESGYEKEDQLIAARNKKVQDTAAQIEPEPAQVSIAANN